MYSMDIDSLYVEESFRWKCKRKKGRGRWYSSNKTDNSDGRNFYRIFGGATVNHCSAFDKKRNPRKLTTFQWIEKRGYNTVK